MMSLLTEITGKLAGLIGITAKVDMKETVSSIEESVQHTSDQYDRVLWQTKEQNEVVLAVHIHCDQIKIWDVVKRNNRKQASGHVQDILVDNQKLSIKQLADKINPHFVCIGTYTEKHDKADNYTHRQLILRDL